MQECEVAIIGAGPAGLTAGTYCARYGLETIIIEKAMAGGTANLANSINNWPGEIKTSGLELMTKFKAQAESAGAKIIEGIVLKIKSSAGEKTKLIEMQGETIKAKAVIVCVGSKSKWLKVKGEKELLNKGVHFCATCDGPLYNGKEVVVVGSDNRAAEEALYLSSIAKNVTVVCEKEKLEAEQPQLDALKKQKNVEVLLQASVSEFHGKNSLEEVVVKDSKRKNITIKATGAFIYAGTEPNTEIVEAKKDSEGRLLVNQEMETNVKGIFAAGDCIKKELYQIVTAASEGATAAHSASKLIQSE